MPSINSMLRIVTAKPRAVAMLPQLREMQPYTPISSANASSSSFIVEAVHPGPTLGVAALR